MKVRYVPKTLLFRGLTETNTPYETLKQKFFFFKYKPYARKPNIFLFSR
jgi:hypothetical protein